MSTYDNGEPMPDVWQVEPKPSPFVTQVSPAEYARISTELDAPPVVNAALLRAARRLNNDPIFESPQHRYWMQGTDRALADIELDGLGAE